MSWCLLVKVAFLKASYVFHSLLFIIQHPLFSKDTDMQEENMWARLHDSCPGMRVRFTQPSPHIVLYFCA